MLPGKVKEAGQLGKGPTSECLHAGLMGQFQELVGSHFKVETRKRHKARALVW